jgi:hypothetical protein
VPDVTERMNYFDRQFLRADDFQDEQAYHLDRRRGHNAGFHSAGVVEGLLVIPGGQADTVTVERGWAVDAQGREIVLATPRADVPTGGVDVDVWISYPDPEPLSTPVVEAGTSGSPRVLEVPVIGVVPPGTVPANALRLARVTAAGAIDNSVRVLAGLKNNAVVEANLADNAVSSRVLAEAETGTAQDANSGTGVKTAHLKDRAVTEPKLADNAASNRVVLNGAITETKLANSAVSAVKLRSDAATSANRAVGPDHIQNQAVTSRAIAPADPGNTQDVPPDSASRRATSRTRRSRPPSWRTAPSRPPNCSRTPPTARGGQSAPSTSRPIRSASPTSDRRWSSSQRFRYRAPRPAR